MAEGWHAEAAGESGETAGGSAGPPCAGPAV